MMPKKELSQHISASCTLYIKELHVACELPFGHLHPKGLIATSYKK